MRHLGSFAARVPLVRCCCCCCSSSEGVEQKEKPKAMEIPTFQLWRKSAGVAPATAGRTTVSTSRLPSTRLSTGRPLTPAPSVVSSLATSDPKVLQSERRDLAFTVGVKVIPHPDKVAKGGEDAYFISPYDGGVLGVADGVSGWAEENVDPALFSKELMAHALAAVEDEEVRNDPRELIAKAHSATVSIGAATAIIAILEKKGVLHVANVGDCGLRVLRGGKVVYATAPQQHYFDCPYQLSSENAQTADDATIYELGVVEGDTIVMGSDGLFDNVYDSEIEATLKIFGSLLDDDLVKRAALALASLACTHAKDKNYDSPYAKEAVSQGRDLPWWYKVVGRKIGGKIDDITVVVGHIVGKPRAPEDELMAEKQTKAEAREQISVEEQVLIVEQIASEEQVSAQEQSPVEEQVSAQEQSPVEEQGPTEDANETEEELVTIATIIAAEEQSPEESSPEEQTPAEEQLPSDEQTSIGEQVSTAEPDSEA